MSPKHCLRFQALDVLQKCPVLKQWLMAPRPSCYLKSGPKDCSYTLHSSNHGDQIVPIICQPTGVYKNKKKRFNSFNYLLYNLRGLNKLLLKSDSPTPGVAMREVSGPSFSSLMLHARTQSWAPWGCNCRCFLSSSTLLKSILGMN